MPATMRTASPNRYHVTSVTPFGVRLLLLRRVSQLMESWRDTEHGPHDLATVGREDTPGLGVVRDDDHASAAGLAVTRRDGGFRGLVCDGQPKASPMFGERQHQV